MKNKSIISLFMLLWLVMPTVGKAQISASVVEGVAPLLVHFEAEYNQNEFHTANFNWAFDDPNCGVWGTNQLSKNKAQGAITAHLFETPGIYTVQLQKRLENGTTSTFNTTITITDPNTVFAGNLTVCVNPAGDANFNGAPAGALQISINDLSTITQYATSGRRILFKRGASWTTAGLNNWPENEGTVIIGAYGTGTNPDAFGIFANNPQITVTGGSFLPLDYKQDWRIMDIQLNDPTRAFGSFGGAQSFKKWLFLRLKTNGFDVPIGWSTWNDPLGNTHADQMGIVSCVFENAGVNVGYVGSERLMILGSVFKDAQESHVLRIWQSYKGVISHNQMSGSSLATNTGRHAMKFHGPSEAQMATTEWSHLNKRTQFSIISHNLYGYSGPWPIMIAPQDDWTDERISNIIFEKNQYFSDFGSQSALSLQPSVILTCVGTDITVRNNIFDATAFGAYFTGISVRPNNVAPVPTNIHIYHNTIFKGSDPNGQIWYGIHIQDSCGTVTALNNLVMFPYVCAGHFSVFNESPNTTYSNNVLNGTITFLNPTHTDPLLRSFDITQNSISSINMGYLVPSVYDDFSGTLRPIGTGYDVGAYEFDPSVGFAASNPNEYLKIYPNPTSQWVNISCSGEIEWVELMNGSGIQMATFYHTNILDLSIFPSGIYFVKVHILNQLPIVEKVIITK